MRKDKDAEFIRIKQGDKTIGEYEAKFEELPKFSSYLRNTLDEAWQANHFENGLRAEIRKEITTLEITDFSQLVNKCKLAKRSIREDRLEKEKEYNKRGKQT